MSIGIAPNGEFVETNPRTVRNLRGVGGTAGDLKMMERDGGGVSISTFGLQQVYVLIGLLGLLRRRSASVN